MEMGQSGSCWVLHVGEGGGRRAAGGQGSHHLRITKIPPQANKKSIYIWNIIQFCTLIKY